MEFRKMPTQNIITKQELLSAPMVLSPSQGSLTCTDPFCCCFRIKTTKSWLSDTMSVCSGSCSCQTAESANTPTRRLLESRSQG